MTRQKRRIVAFVAARLVSGKHSEAVHDHSTSTNTRVSGRVSPDRIRVYDYDRLRYVSGDGSGGVFSLRDHATGQGIRLHVEGHEFEGYDQESATPFNGTVDGTSVSFFDSADAQQYHYAI